MGVAERLHGLVDDAYSAALDDASWAPWTAKLVEELGGIGGILAVVDAAAASITRLSWHAPTVPPAGLRDYADHWGAHDPQVPFVAGLRRSTVYIDTDHLRSDDPASGKYMAWSRGEFGWDHHLTGVALLDDGGLRAGLSIHRDPAAGHVPAAERRKFEAIFPQVRRALMLGHRHRAKLQDAWWQGMAGGEREAALLIDHAGRILRASPAAEAILAAGDGLSGVGDRPLAASDNDGLQAVLTRAISGGRSGTVLVGRRATSQPLIVTAWPLPPDGAILGPPSSRALVVIVDPTRAPSRRSAAADAFGFTPREAELATLLMAGHSVESAAAVLTITQPTARIHLRRLLAKTGTVRQSELVRLLGRVG